jgi:ribosome recycling factor
MTNGTRITIRRPNGQVETVDKAGEFFSSAMRQKMTAATKAAGRGEIINFEEIVPPPTLEEQRRELVAAVRDALDEASYQYERAHAREDARAEIIRREYDAKATVARAALEAFDAAHPEIVETLRANKAAADAAAVDRFLRID